MVGLWMIPWIVRWHCRRGTHNCSNARRLTLHVGRSGIGIRLFLGLCAFNIGSRATVLHLGIGALYGAHRGRRPLPQQAQQQRIKHDETDQQEPAQHLHLAHGETQHKRAERHNSDTTDQRHDLDTYNRTDWHNCQRHGEGRIAKKTAQTKAVIPPGTGGQGRGINRQHGNRNRCKNQTTQRALFAMMQGQTGTPSNNRNRNSPSAPAHNHKDRCRDRGPKAAQPVLHGRICG